MKIVQTVVATAGQWLAKWFGSVCMLELPDRLGYETVEFFGGPFDGHTEQLPAARIYQVPPVLEVSVSRARFDLIQGIEPQQFDQPTSIAIYDLVFNGRQWQFRFSHQVHADAASADHCPAD